MSQYLSLHNHSTSSTRDGILSPKDIAKKCKECNMSVAITDHGSTGGFIDYYNSCKDHGVKPVFGVELYTNKYRERILELRGLIKSTENPQLKSEYSYEFDEKKKYRHLLLVAKNFHGFQNILHINNHAYNNGFYEKPIATYKEVFALPKQNGDRGLIVTTACLASESSQLILNEEYEACEDWLLEMRDEFKDDFYLEIQINDLEIQKRVNDKIIEYNKKLKIPMIVGNDAHYLSKEYSEAHQLFLLLQGKQKVSDIGKKQWRVVWETPKGEIRKKKFEKNANFKKGINVEDIEVGKVYDKLKIVKKQEVDKVWLIEGADLNLLSEEELRKKVKKEHKEIEAIIDELINNNKKINDKIEHFKIDTSIKLPRFENETEEIRRKTSAGLIAKINSGEITDFKENKQKYIDRIKYELDIIIANGFASYFLILEDALNYAREEDVPLGAGRGSVVGSFVAYCMGLHRVNPFTYNMRFERFLSPDRDGQSSYPDADSDLGENPLNGKSRDTVIAYLKNKYGKNNIAYVANKINYAPKTIIRDLGQVYEIPSKETLACSKVYNDDISPSMNISQAEKDFKKNGEKSALFPLREYFRKYPHIKDLIPKFEKTISSIGTHAGGVIISDKKYPLMRFASLQKPTEDGVLSSAWDKKEVEKAGFIKYDFLHIDAAVIIHIAKQMVGLDPYKDITDTDNIENSDAIFSDIVFGGDNQVIKHKNIFQFESDLGKRAFADLMPKSIIELANASGLIRVLGSDAGRNVYNQYKENIEAYQRGDKQYWEEQMVSQIYDKKNINACKDVLAETYGILIYQEQLAQLVENLTGGKSSFSKGNQIRKDLEAMPKKLGLGYVDQLQGDKLALKKWHDYFMKVLNDDLFVRLGKDGWDSSDKDVINFLNFKLDSENHLPIPKQGIISWFISSSAYLFSKLHSVAYSINTFQMMYLKHFHPLEFWTASLICKSASQDHIEKFIVALEGETGTKVLHPDINKSGIYFSIEDKNIRYGLSSILSVGHKAADAIVCEREANGPFKSLNDFFERVPGRLVNKRVIENLVLTNCFAEFGDVKSVNAKISQLKNLESFEYSDRDLIDIERKMLGVNITFVEPMLKEAKKYLAMSEINNGETRMVVLKILKSTKKETAKKKPYIMHRVESIKDHQVYNLFDWDNSELKTGAVIKCSVKLYNGFYSLVKVYQ